ncbi:MAG: anhydro-N-acetylmuramic acid kinase, partial [Nannocystaceae bacterium]|nr:anhydro-N-acetylmuramic acid kinase [Nannocystaceae bacterium]
MTLALGLMSGTSCDGVDALLLDIDELDACHTPRVLGHAFHPFPQALQAELREPTKLTLPRIAALGFELAERYADVVRAIPQWATAAVVGMHGQTVWHAPPSHGPAHANTLQLGSSGALATTLGLPVVADMRSSDIALGGEGAPIAPIAHWMFTPPRDAGRLVVNVGGIANVTFIADDRDQVVASDVGPGMMITDALARHVSGGTLSFDEDGRLSAGGSADPALVRQVMAHAFFSRPLPRSTGREDFGQAYCDALRLDFPTLSGADLLASSLDATAAAITRAASEDLKGVTEILLTGGGACHP